LKTVLGPDQIGAGIYLFHFHGFSNRPLRTTHTRIRGLACDPDAFARLLQGASFEIMRIDK